MNYCDRCGVLLHKDNNKKGFAICDTCDDILVKEVQARKMNKYINCDELNYNLCNDISCNECPFNGVEGQTGCLLFTRIDKLPRVTPTKKRTGHWIDAIEPIPLEERDTKLGFTYKIAGYKCSECGAKHEEHSLSMIATKTNYCPNCGAKMEVNNE